MQDNEEARKLRERYRELAGRADRLAVKGQAGVSRFVGKVYDGGSIPTTVPKVFLTHPATIFSPDTEGGTATATVDTSQSIPVWVVGPGVPVADDYVIARGVNYRYAADFPAAVSTRPSSLTFQGSYFTGSFETAVGGTMTLDAVNNWWVATIILSGISKGDSPACVSGSPYIRVRVVDNLDGTYAVYYEQGQITDCSGLSCLAYSGAIPATSAGNLIVVRKTGTITSTAAGPTLSGTWPAPTNDWDANPTGCPGSAWVFARLDNTLGFSVHP